MQCWFSERGCRGAPSSVRSVVPGLGGIAVLLAAAVVLSGCRTTTTVTYLPTPERARMSLEQGSATLVQFMQVQCGEIQARGGADSVIARVVVGDNGEVQESELESGTGSESADNIIGAITAQLTFADETPVPSAGAARVLASFSCTRPASAKLSRLP